MALGPFGVAASVVGERVMRARAGYRSVDAPDGWAHTPTESLWVTADGEAFFQPRADGDRLVLDGGRCTYR